MNKTTVLMAAVLAIATVLAAGSTALGSVSVQEAQANPCSVFSLAPETEIETDCDIIAGSIEINEAAPP
jgi:curli biogenesis system outer membrane secretion channel CsgG